MASCIAKCSKSIRRDGCAIRGSAANGKYGSLLDSVVTWTLTPHATGTQLLMEHSGFRSPDNDFAFGAMSGGWAHVLEKIERAVASSA